MTENTLNLDPTNANVSAVVKDGKAGKIVYKRYVEEFGISTKEHVSEHVAALTELAGFDASEKADRKRFGMRVRAGLNYWLPASEESSEEEETIVNLLTVKGTVTFSEMSDEDMVKMIRAEIARRTA